MKIAIRVRFVDFFVILAAVLAVSYAVMPVHAVQPQCPSPCASSTSGPCDGEACPAGDTYPGCKAGSGQNGDDDCEDWPIPQGQANWCTYQYPDDPCSLALPKKACACPNDLPWNWYD